MTRSVTIVNTSNCDQDLVVQCGHEKTVLKRTESRKLGYSGVAGILVSDGDEHGHTYLGEVYVHANEEPPLPPRPSPGSFGFAILRLKEGDKLMRRGWNGKNMHIELEHVACQEGAPQYPPYIVMKTAQGAMQRGWLASQADMLAEDWEVVE